ncbi:expressed unknown protein (Partial), partial [Seminavis robusta]
LLLAIQAIVQQDPTLIGQPNQATCTPLHYAAEKRLVWGNHYYRSGELVLMLLREYPQAVSIRTKTGTGKTPFHVACEANADARVLKAMLLIHPGLATEPFVKRDVYSLAENPLQILWGHSSMNHPNNTQTHEKMALLVRAAHYGTVDDACHDDHHSKIRLVSAACSVRCPQAYFLHLLQEYRQEIFELDEPRQLLPLHYAVSNASVDSQPYTQFVLESLLEVYPDAAAVPNEEGRLPLHVALMDSKLTWHKGGIQELVYAYPSALMVPDPVHHLLPFLASAYNALESMLHLSTTYELLRAAPDVMERLW